MSAIPQSDIYALSSGVTTAYLGRQQPAPPSSSGFTSVTLLRTDSSGPKLTPNQALVLSLHGSGTDPTAFGLLYEGAFIQSLQYVTSLGMQWVVVNSTDGQGAAATRIVPWDRHGTYPSSTNLRSSSWTGWTLGATLATKVFRPITHERLDAILDWADENVPNLSPTKRYITGGSMGAQGGLRYGLRRPDRFAAIYPSRPIWRYRRDDEIFINDFEQAALYWTQANSPPMAGGGTAWDYYDSIAYASNTNNRLPWVGWCVGRNDGGMPFQDHIDAVAAMRAAGRGFAFAWNDGNHSTGDIIQDVYDCYPTGLFELGKGYPLFTEHSLDGDPSVDLAGGINMGLTFRNVTESSGAWSCQVTHKSAACTVKVKPLSQVFLAAVSATTVTIPAANTWVTVSFSA